MRVEELAVEAVAPEVMRSERNCEDAVNVIAYEAYQRIHGETAFADLNIRDMDGLLGAARQYVKAHGSAYGIEWEEF